MSTCMHYVSVVLRRIRRQRQRPARLVVVRLVPPVFLYNRRHQMQQRPLQHLHRVVVAAAAEEAHAVRAIRAHPARQAFPETTDVTDKMVRMVRMERMVRQQRRNVSNRIRSNFVHASQDHREMVAKLARKDHPAHLVDQDQLERTAKVETMAFEAKLAKQVVTVSLDRKDHQAMTELVERKRKDHLEYPASLDRMVHLASLATKVDPAKQVRMASLVMLVSLEAPAVLASKAVMANLERRAHLVQEDPARTAHHHDLRQDTKLGGRNPRSSFAEASLALLLLLVAGCMNFLRR